MADLVSGWLDLIFTPVVNAIQQVRSRQVRVLGITRAERSAQLPDVPAVGEALAGHDVGRRPSPLPMSTSYGEGAAIAVTPAPQGPEAAEERGGEGGQV